jgi:hypothetical protein
MIYIYTTVHPGSKLFFKEFINTINLQSFKNFKLFICFNNIKFSNFFKNKIKVDFLCIENNKHQGKARIDSLKYLLKKNPELIVFIDSDDLMSKNRLAYIVKNIKNYDFFVHNLLLFGNNYKKKTRWLKKRNFSLIKMNEINFKNYIGLSNLAVKGFALKKVINKIGTNLIAFDWCLAKLLLLNKFKGIYSSASLSQYRQYSNNISNLTNFSKLKLLNDLEIKLQHLNFFNNLGLKYNKKINELISLKKKIKNNSYLIKDKKKLSVKRANYWWSYP